jgi:protease PrsW
MPVYTLTICCAAGLVLWISSYDRYEKEPWHALLTALAIGFCAMWLVGQADDLALAFLRISHRNPIAKAGLIAFIEESGKLLTILLLARFVLKKQFNDPMDGLIYGRIVGLGMALEESLLYLSLSPATLQTAGVEVVRLFAHSLMGGMVGFALGLGSTPGKQRTTHPGLALACFALSTALHFVWNVNAYVPTQSVAYRLAPMAIMLVMMLLWQGLCALAENRSKRIFAPEPGPVCA